PRAPAVSAARRGLGATVVICITGFDPLEADRGHEPADSEVPGGAARCADQGAAFRAHGGRRRAPAVGIARAAGWSGPAAAGCRWGRTRRAAGGTPGGDEQATASYRAGRGAGAGVRHPAAGPIA